MIFLLYTGYRFLYHYLISTPIDVLHSPFVFKLYQTCIRRNPASVNIVGGTTGSPRTDQIVERLIRENGFKTGVNLAFDDLEELQQMQIPDSIDYALIRIKETDRIYPAFLRITDVVHNNSMVVFYKMYHSPQSASEWEKVRDHPMVRVTVDLFFIGLVFFRKEQARQHFRLRVF